MFLILITNKSAMYYEQLIVILAQKLPKEYLKILLSLILEIVKFNIGLNPIKHFIYLFFPNQTYLHLIYKGNFQKQIIQIVSLGLFHP